jgi:hypothetical protein
MHKINLPSYEHRLKREEGVTSIFDEFRKKYIQLTPEEWVRQHFLHFLVNHKKFPAGLLMVEKELRIGSLKRRPDLVVYSKNAQPVLLAEFKAPSVPVDEDTLFQIALYNKKLQVPYLILSNGIQHFCARIDLSTGLIEYLPDFPEYTEL